MSDITDIIDFMTPMIKVPDTMTERELRKVGMAYAGKPEIDRKQVAAFFDMSESDFESIMANSVKLERALQRGFIAGPLALEMRQMDTAFMGEKTMLKHLGEHKLGQIPKARTEVTGVNGGPVVMLTEDKAALERFKEMIIKGEI